MLSHASQSGADAVITVGGSTLTLQNTTVTYLNAHQARLLV